MSNIKQKFQVDLSSGESEEIVADSYRFDLGNYTFYQGSEIVRIIACDDIVEEYDSETGEQTKGIKTTLSRSVI